MYVTMTEISFIKAYRWLMVVSVSGAVGAVSNLVLFFLAALLFAGADGVSWVKWYFGNWVVFILVTIVLSIVALPFIKRLSVRLI